MKAFNFEQWKESELQKFVGLKGNMVEWRYGYVEKKIDYTLKTQGEKPMNITTRDFLQMLYGKMHRRMHYHHDAAGFQK